MSLFNFIDVATCGCRSFFSCGFTAGVKVILFTVPKALRRVSSGVLKVLAVMGDVSFSTGSKKKKNMLEHHFNRSDVTVE